MSIDKPWTVVVLSGCHGLDHSLCSGIHEDPDITLICSCRCHHQLEETPVSDTITTDTITTETVTATKTRWTPAEVEYLTANATKGARVIAQQLNRTEDQVRAKAGSLGVSLRMEGSSRGRRMRTR